MAPLQPWAPCPHNSRSPRRGLPPDGGAGGSGSGCNKRSLFPHLPPLRSASFHGRTTPSPVSPSPASPSHHPMRRPKTQPDLLASPGGRRMIVSSPTPPPAHDLLILGPGQQRQQQPRRVPAKVLVNVNLQRSIGALQVMASTDWTVDQLVSASIKQYLKEGRRPPLPTTHPSDFGLHYSQFSLDCLNPKEKLVGLGSRNFFLCPKQNAATTPSVSPNFSSVHSAISASSYSDAAASSSDTLPVSSQSSAACCRESDKTSKISIPWLRFMDFLL